MKSTATQYALKLRGDRETLCDAFARLASQLWVADLDVEPYAIAESVVPSHTATWLVSVTAPSVESQVRTLVTAGGAQLMHVQPLPSDA